MIYLDSNVFIYAINDKGEKGKACRQILRELTEKKFDGSTSLLTWDEISFNLMKYLNFQQVCEAGKNFLLFPNLQLLNVNKQILDLAQIFFERGLKPRDAIHA